MGSFSTMHWIIVLIVVILVFGTGKLKNLGRDLGGAIKGFKQGMNEDKDAANTTNTTNTTTAAVEHTVTVDNGVTKKEEQTIR